MSKKLNGFTLIGLMVVLGVTSVISLYMAKVMTDMQISMRNL